MFGPDDSSYVVSSVLGKVAEQSYCSDHLMAMGKNSQSAVQLGDDDVPQLDYTFHLHLFSPSKEAKTNKCGNIPLTKLVTRCGLIMFATNCMRITTAKKSTCGITALLFSFSRDDPREGMVVTLLFTFTHVRYSKEIFGEQGDGLQFSERGIATFLLATLQHVCDLFKADQSSSSPPPAYQSSLIPSPIFLQCSSEGHAFCYYILAGFELSEASVFEEGELENDDPNAENFLQSSLILF